MHYINSPELFHESVSLCSNTCIGEFYKLFIIALKNVCFLEEAHYNYENGQLGYFYKKLSLWVCGKHLRDSLPQLQTHGRTFRSLLLGNSVSFRFPYAGVPKVEGVNLDWNSHEPLCGRVHSLPQQPLVKLPLHTKTYSSLLPGAPHTSATAETEFWAL